MDILVDDSSPQFSWITVQPRAVGWVVQHDSGSPYPDPFTNRYSEGTFHATFSEGDRMEYRFNGSGISMHGAKRGNHGVYGVSIDEGEEKYFDGQSSTEDIQTVLYETADLGTDREHMIRGKRVTNYPSKSLNREGNLWVDIDHVVVTQPITSTIYTTYIDDTSSLIHYDSGWDPFGDGTGGFYNRTNHMCTRLGSSMSFGFNGSSIQIFGGINTDHGNYSISLDGGPEQIYSSYNWQLVYRVTLFTVSGLPDASHTIVYRNIGPLVNTVAGFDYAVVNSTIKPEGYDAGAGPELTMRSESTTWAGTGSGAGLSTAVSGPSDTANRPASGGEPSGSIRVSVGALSGGLAGGVVALALLAVLVYWLLRRRRQSRKHARAHPHSHPDGEGGYHHQANVGHQHDDEDLFHPTYMAQPTPRTEREDEPRPHVDYDRYGENSSDLVDSLAATAAWVNSSSTAALQSHRQTYKDSHEPGPHLIPSPNSAPALGLMFDPTPGEDESNRSDLDHGRYEYASGASSADHTSHPRHITSRSSHFGQIHDGLMIYPAGYLNEPHSTSPVSATDESGPTALGVEMETREVSEAHTIPRATPMARVDSACEGPEGRDKCFAWG
ncbi:hypothetical protein IAU60_006822 [Kwoniella sp. DSM 27419]